MNQFLGERHCGVCIGDGASQLPVHFVVHPQQNRHLNTSKARGYVNDVGQGTPREMTIELESGFGVQRTAICCKLSVEFDFSAGQ